MVEIRRGENKSLCLVACFALAAFGPAAAQDVGADIVDATTGQWLIASEDGSLGCHVTLEKDKTIGGYALTEGTPCGAPWHDELQAWDFSDAGLNATRKNADSLRRAGRRPLANTAACLAEDLFHSGSWHNRRGAVAKAAVGSWVLTDEKGKPLCHISLLDRPSSWLEDAKALELSKDRAASVRKTKVDAWQISEINLVTIGG